MGLLGEAILRVDQYLIWLTIDATTLDQHPWQLCSRANAQPVGSIVRHDYIALLQRHQANTSLSSLLSFKQEAEEERSGIGSRSRLGALQASHWLRSQTLGGISGTEPLVAEICPPRLTPTMNPILMAASADGVSSFYHSLAFCHDGSLFMAATSTGRVGVWDSATHLLVEQMICPGHAIACSAAAWSPDQEHRYLAVLYSTRASVRTPEGSCLGLWERYTGVYKQVNEMPARSFGWSPCGCYLVADTGMYILDHKVPTMYSIITLHHPIIITPTARTTLVYSIATMSCLAVLRGSAACWQPLQPTQPLLLRDSYSDVIAATASHSRRFEDDDDAASKSALPPLLLAYYNGFALDHSATVDHSIHIYDASSRCTIASLRGHSHEVKWLAWSPCGTRLLSGTAEHAVLLWQVERQCVEYLLRGKPSTLVSTPSNTLSILYRSILRALSGMVWQLPSARCGLRRDD